MDIGVLFFGVGIGMIISAALVGLGVEIANKRHNTNVLDADSDTLVYVPHRDRDRGGGDGQDKQMDAQEVVNALQTIRMALSRTEKEALDYAIECVVIREKLLQHIERVQRGETNEQDN